MKVLIIGDFLIDRFTYGSYTGKSPENDDLKVFTSRKTEDRFGGAANVAYNCYFHAEETTLIGSLKENISTPFSFVNIGGKSVQPVIERFIIDKKTIFRHDSLLKESHDYNVDTDLYDVIILEDYGWGVLENPQKIIQSSKCPVIVDPIGKNWTKYSGSYCIKSNNFEFEIACGELNLKNVRIAIERYQLNCMIITLGEKGVWYIDNDNDFKIPAMFHDAIDPIGAGDTFISILACYFDKNNIYNSVALANIGAGLVCQKFGTYALRQSDLLTYDSNLITKMNGYSNKKSNDHQLSVALSQTAKSPKNDSIKDTNTVVFTCGCFDIIHHNHLILLKKAYNLGSKLIVGLNSDASMTRIKRKPTIKQDERKLFLELLPFVDEVIIFEEDTALALIEKINPDILVKGADYDFHNLIEKNLDLKIVLIDAFNDLSSSAIINRIKINQR